VGHSDVCIPMSTHRTPLSTINRTPARFGLASALMLTLGVAAAAWFLADVAQLSERTIVLGVMAVSFVASWVLTGVRRKPMSHHRVTVVPHHARPVSSR